MEDDGNNKANDEMVDDPNVLWLRLQESGRKRMKLMNNEKDQLQKEIDTMRSIVAAAANISDDDIIEIDAGGKIIKALRSTLTLVPDTVLAYMFSGRWEGSLKRDSNGRIYLEHDPELIELIVNFLRTKKIEDPSSDKVIVCPKIPEGKEQAFEVLLNYFGLTDFFYPPVVILPLDITNIDVIQPHGSNTTLTKCEEQILFLKNTHNYSYNFIACKPKIDSSGEGSFWKITIGASPIGWIYLGIIGNLDASDDSQEDSTSYGWASSSTSYHGGTNRNGYGGWNGFNQGECLYFHLKEDKLAMFSVQKNQKFTINVATTGTYYIHFNILCINSMLTLEKLVEEERARFL